MKINKILKMKSNKYKIIIDGESFITYDDVIISNNLLYQKELDKDLYKKVIIDTKFYDIYDKTVKYILKKRRSEKEVIEYLNKYNLSNNDVDNIISKLKTINLINDEEYCRAYINDKVHLNKNGINKIRIDLLNQDIPSNIIEKEINNIDESLINENLKGMILKKLNSNRKYSNSNLKQKILSEMINLGYPKDKILEIIDDNILSDEEIIKKEFDKMYNKLKLKYSGLELQKKLKQKLIYKGFDIEDINNLIIEKTED